MYIAHRAHKTVELLHRETPLDFRLLNSPDHNPPVEIGAVGVESGTYMMAYHNSLYYTVPERDGLDRRICHNNIALCMHRHTDARQQRNDFGST